MKSSDVWISEEGIVFTGNLGGVKLLDDPVDVLREVLEENRRMREALEFYADKNNWSQEIWLPDSFGYDIARRSLADIDAEGNGAEEGEK